MSAKKNRKTRPKHCKTSAKHRKTLFFKKTLATHRKTPAKHPQNTAKHRKTHLLTKQTELANKPLRSRFNKGREGKLSIPPIGSKDAVTDSTSRPGRSGRKLGFTRIYPIRILVVGGWGSPVGGFPPCGVSPRGVWGLPPSGSFVARSSLAFMSSVSVPSGVPVPGRPPGHQHLSNLVVCPIYGTSFTNISEFRKFSKNSRSIFATAVG